MTRGSVWPVGVLSQSVTRGLFPGLCNLVLQVVGVVGLIYDMWLIVTCRCIVPICDMWLISWSVWSFVTSYWCSLPNLWHVALCDLLVYFPNPWPVQDLMVYLVKYMTCGSLWTCFIIIQKYDEWLAVTLCFIHTYVGHMAHCEL